MSSINSSLPVLPGNDFTAKLNIDSMTRTGPGQPGSQFAISAQLNATQRLDGEMAPGEGLASTGADATGPAWTRTSLDDGTDLGRVAERLSTKGLTIPTVFLSAFSSLAAQIDRKIEGFNDFFQRLLGSRESVPAAPEVQEAELDLLAGEDQPVAVSGDRTQAGAG